MKSTVKCDFFKLFAEVVVIFKNVVNFENLVNVAVCPLHIKLFSFKQFYHIFLFCLDRKRGVNPIAACKNVLAGEVWVSACLEDYVPECFLISHNGN